MTAVALSRSDQRALLLSEARRAVASGDLTTALRAATRAYRLSPTVLEISLLIARLNIALRRPDAAVDHLQIDTSNRQRVEFDAALIDALRLVGQYDAAGWALAKALTHHSVNPGDDLAVAAHRLISDENSRQVGWIGLQTDLRLIGELRTDDEAALLLAIDDLQQPFQAVRANGDGTVGLLTLAPVTRPGRLTARAAGDSLLGEGLYYPPDYRLNGRCSIIDGVLQGWVEMGWAPNLRPVLELTSSSGQLWITELKGGDSAGGMFKFDIDLHDIGLQVDEVAVAVRLPDGDVQPLPDSPARAYPPPAPKPRPRRLSSAVGASAPIVDVVIPAFRGRAETLTCLLSVLTTTRGLAEVIVIDDASPDPDLKGDLDQLSQSGRIRLLRNDENRGFPHAVNQGVALNPDRDVIILNSDAEAYGDWLQRLRSAAYSSERIGTVTPLTNCGSIVSYPGGEPSNCSAALGRQRDAWAKSVNTGHTIEAPTGVGFCLYIKRECLAATGPFDEAAFLRGYGEENDFCMRASAGGWRHVVAADVYVRHTGSISFGEGRFALQERNARLLSQRHPTYDDAVARHHRADPLAPARRRLAAAELKMRAGQGVGLVISLGIGGGVDRFIQMHSETLQREGLTVLVLESLPEGKVQLKVLGIEALPDLVYGWREIDDAVLLLDALNIRRVELHHFLDHSEAWIDRLLQGRDYAVYLHDFSWYCPRLSLLGGDSGYCGEPDAAGCQACIDRFGSSIEGEDNVEAVRARSRRWLGHATEVIAASEDTAERYRRHFPNLAVHIEPWENDAPFVPKAPPPGHGSLVRVAVVGAVGEQKGSLVLLACAKDAAARRLPLEFVLLGFSDIDNDLTATGRVFISGRYKEDELQTLLAAERPHLAFLPSVTPETWSFTLSHLLNAGIVPIAFDLGTISQRIRAAGLADFLLELDLSPQAINDRLLSLASKAFPNRMNIGAANVPDMANSNINAVRLSDSDSPASRGIRIGLQGETTMPATLPAVRASAQLLPLSRGVYLFSVDAATARPSVESDITLPALLLSPAPGTEAKNFEFLGGLRTEGAWLRGQRDVQVLKVNSGDAVLLVTSYTASDGAPLSMQVERLDGRPRSSDRASESPTPPAPAQLAAPPAQRPAGQAPASGETARGFRTQITAHIANRGDVNFVAAPWAGTLSERFPIEAFTIAPLEGIASNYFEYKALLANGSETPWVEGGQLCGTQRQRMAITGFAIRLKVERSNSFTAEYSGRFTSGRMIGPMRDGQPCASDTAGDALYAMQVVITEKEAAAQNVAPAFAGALASNALLPQGPPAPRFSVFRQE